MAHLHRVRFLKGHDETTVSLLPNALLQCGMDPETWREYAMFVRCDMPDNTTSELCLNFSEYPLRRFNELKEKMRNPKFVLKHMDDIPSPVLSARMKGKRKRAHLSTSNSYNSCEEETPLLQAESASSFGIAVFPYAAEQDDELDIDLDDIFMVISKPEPGWWLVQRYIPAGDESTSRRGLVPSGCFLETLVPPLFDYSPEPSTRSLTIPFSDVISRSRRIVVLMDYAAKHEGELTVTKGELANEYKRYRNWSYVIKLENGERGWVPMWLVAFKP